jgi:hypothetical protein
VNQDEDVPLDLATRLDRAASIAELEACIQSCIHAADGLRLWQTSAYLDHARCFIWAEAKIDPPSIQPLDFEADNGCEAPAQEISGAGPLDPQSGG